MNNVWKQLRAKIITFEIIENLGWELNFKLSKYETKYKPVNCGQQCMMRWTVIIAKNVAMGNFTLKNKFGEST